MLISRKLRHAVAYPDKFRVDLYFDDAPGYHTVLVIFDYDYSLGQLPREGDMLWIGDADPVEVRYADITPSRREYALYCVTNSSVDMTMKALAADRRVSRITFDGDPDESVDDSVRGEDWNSLFGPGRQLYDNPPA